MKDFVKYFFFVIILFIFGCGNNGLLSPGTTGENLITEELVKHNIEFLASDSLKGRNTPSPELDSAAAYIAGKFKAYGLQPIKGSYFQNVKLGYIKLGTDNRLIVKTNGDEIQYKIKTDFTPFEMTANKTADAPIIFAGYGIDAPEYNYNDYANIDVKGKIVFVLRHEPGEKDPESKFKGKNATKYSSVNEKVKIAIERGAAGVLVAQDPLNHIMLAPQGFPWPALSVFIPEDAIPLSILSGEEEKIPVVQVGENIIKRLFGSVEKLKNIQADIDKRFKPNSFELPNTLVSLKTSTNISETDASNVVGFLEGSDPALKDEIIIIGAHYDHVGFNKTHQPGEDYIFNGADDNASGTAAVMAVAAALGGSAPAPKRSVLFIAFCGEEKGLFGSLYYTRNPLFPKEKSIAMLNLDMIGRNNIDSLTIYGCGKNPKLLARVQLANKNIGFNFNLQNEIENGDSDHSSFQKIGIPSLCFHSGIHADLHKVSDEASKINYNKVVKTAKLTFNAVELLANDGTVFK